MTQQPASTTADVLTDARTIPVLRMFSLERTREFYLGFLGFRLD